jgi:hypothetical protein
MTQHQITLIICLFSPYIIYAGHLIDVHKRSRYGAGGDHRTSISREQREKKSLSEYCRHTVDLWLKGNSQKYFYLLIMKIQTEVDFSRY